MSTSPDLIKTQEASPEIQDDTLENTTNSKTADNETDNETNGDSTIHHKEKEERERKRQQYLAFLAKFYNDEGEMQLKQRSMAASTVIQQVQGKFTIISWNLDGLDDENLRERTDDVIDIIMRKDPAIVLFQELVPHTYVHIFKGLASKYLAIPGTGCPPSGYHTGTFLNFNQVRHLDHYIKPFLDSTMGRNLLVTKVQIGQVKLALLNTHLESMLASSDKRKAQLKTCFQVAQSFPPDFNVLFGGDLNLREWEVKGLIPEDMRDLWEENGSRPFTRYTWDLRKNTNKQMDCDPQPRIRFDRFYFRSSFPSTINSQAKAFSYFGLAGTEKVLGIDYFPSDHFAIVTSFRQGKHPYKKELKNETQQQQEGNWRE